MLKNEFFSKNEIDFYFFRRIIEIKKKSPKIRKKFILCLIETLFF